MIPRIIHYCWFGGSAKPAEAIRFIEGWRKQHPDFQIIEWNEDNFDINCCDYVREAYAHRKYAFVSDYARGKALFEMGGIYLDTDVELVGRLDSLLEQKGFIGFEHGNSVATSTMGFSPHHPLMEKYISQYKNRNFVRSDGSLDTTTNVTVLTQIALKEGLELNGVKQILKDGTLCLPMQSLSPLDYVNLIDHRDGTTVAIHHYRHTWGSPVSRIRKNIVRTIAMLVGGKGIRWIRNRIHSKRLKAKEDAKYGPKKILFVAHGLHIGGVERSLIGLLRAIPKDAAEINLFLLEHRGELLPQVPPNVELLPVAPSYEALVSPLRKVLFSRYFLVGLARLIAKLPVTIRNTFGFAPGFLLARSHRYAMPFLPKISETYDLAVSFLTPHDLVSTKVNAGRKVGWIHTDYTSLETGVAVGFEQRAWEKMDKIVAVSTEVATSFTKVFPDLANRVIVIENVLDSGWVRLRAGELNSSEMDEAKFKGYLILCSVGRVTHQKGFDIAVEAARRLKDKGLKFRWYVIGFGPDEALIRRKIDELGVSEEFILLGSRENPYPYMKACDIYIQPSRYEGKAVSIREAQMLGKPVLVSDFSTVRSQIEHGADGYIVPAGVDGLVEGVLLLNSDKILCSLLAKTAAEREYGNLSEAQKVLDLVPKS